MPMQSGSAAEASRKWFSIVSGAQAEYCSSNSTPNALAASRAPVVRASVAPSPALPPICMYITSPSPRGPSVDCAKAAPPLIKPATREMAAVSMIRLRCLIMVFPP